jgi:hypothetical protein
MFKVRFQDNSEFTGGEPDESHWNEMPVKPIASLQYSLLGVTILMKGFLSYNHLVEHTVILNNGSGKVSQGADRISRIILMGEWGNRIYEVIYDLGQGRIYQQVRVFSKRIMNNHATSNHDISKVTGMTGWRKGIIEFNSHPKIRRI